jgi:hypothetical protein
MTFQDKTLHCSDCGNSFIFSAEEQSFFESKGYREPNAVHYAVEQEGHRGLTAMVMNGQCFQQYVLNVVSELRCHSNYVRIHQYTVENATTGPG